MDDNGRLQCFEFPPISQDLQVVASDTDWWTSTEVCGSTWQKKTATALVCSAIEIQQTVEVQQLSDNFIIFVVDYFPFPPQLGMGFSDTLAQW